VYARWRARVSPKTNRKLGRVLIPAWLAVVTLLAAACTGSTTPASYQAPSQLTATPSTPSAEQAPWALSAGQRLRFKRISVEQGLSQSTVTCVLQDSRGFMWFGTRGGLNRYDGSGIRVYRHDPQNRHSLGHNQVTALAEDQAGMLWIGTGNGLDRLGRRAGQFIHHQNNPADPNSLRGATIESIYQDHEGILWVRTNGSGLSRLDPSTGRVTHLQHDPNDPHS
jgi:streptogramin lyase